MPAFMTMEEMTDHGPMIILGAPFLRAYAVVFDRSNPQARTLGMHAVPSGSHMCSGCNATLDVVPSPSPAANGFVFDEVHAPTEEVLSSGAMLPPTDHVGSPRPQRRQHQPMSLSFPNLRFPMWMSDEGRRVNGQFVL